MVTNINQRFEELIDQLFIGEEEDQYLRGNVNDFFSRMLKSSQSVTFRWEGSNLINYYPIELDHILFIFFRIELPFKDRIQFNRRFHISFS